jgi:hypothetical protein
LTEPPDRDTAPKNVSTAAGDASDQAKSASPQEYESSLTLSAEEFRKAWTRGQTLAALSLAQQEKEQDQER